MISILNCWRQFGRHYFWPHLLLGMVAAGFGTPSNLIATLDQVTLSDMSASQTRHHYGTINVNYLALLYDAHRRPASSIDYWHQHALRTAIRHLSFFLAPQTCYAQAHKQVGSFQIQQLTLLDALNTLLTNIATSPVLIHAVQRINFPLLSLHQPGLWLAQVQGIRAGPAHDR